MDGKINRIQYAKLEGEWAKAIESGKKVDVDVQVSYDEASKRPQAYKVTYRIEGQSPITQRFLNLRKE
jgi:hypothetical protein